MSGIKVLDLPRGVTVKRIKIYFSKPENGGGKVKHIYYPLHGDAAVVLFEDRDAADIVLSEKLTGSFRDAYVEKLPLTQMYMTLTAELSPVIAEYLQAMPDVLDEIQYGSHSDIKYHYDKARNRATLTGNWYQLEWAWKHVEDLMQVQTTAHSQVARHAARTRQDHMGMDIDEPMNEPASPPRGTQRGKGDNPIISMPASAGRSRTSTTRHSREVDQHDSSYESEPSETASREDELDLNEDIGGSKGAVGTQNRHAQTKKDAGRMVDTDEDIAGPTDEVAGAVRGKNVTKDRRLTEILNDKPEDPRSLDFRHGPVVVSIYTGNIILSETDAIVNAANEFLSHAGGVAYAIASAASPRLKDECEKHIRENGYLNTADVMHTCAGGRLNAKVKHIMHAVGPFWGSELDPESRSRSAHMLTRTFLNILTYANKHLKIQSVTVPLISSGVYGGPMEGCVRAFLNAILIFVKDHCDGPVTLREVHLINNNSDSTVMTVMQIRECLGQQVDQLTEAAASEFEKMSMEDVVRRPRASGRSSDLSSSVRMERYQSMPSSLTGIDFSRSVISPRDASGPTSLGYTSSRSRYSGDDDDDDIVVGSRINPNTSPTSVGRSSVLMRSLSSDHTGSGGRPERSLQVTTASKGMHMTQNHLTYSSQSGARATTASTGSHMTQNHLTSSSQSGARATTASSGSHMTQSHLTSLSQSGARATTKSSATSHTSGRPLPSTPK